MRAKSISMKTQGKNMKYHATIVKKYTSVFLIALASLSLSGCSIFGSNPPPPEKTPKVYRVSFRQIPPEPVYDRVKLVYLPDIKPDSELSGSEGTILNPLVKLSLKNSTLEQAAIALAALGNYHPYTASSVAKQKVSLEAYGTIDEVALELASKSGAHVIIDHPNKQISILEQSTASTTEPKFLEDKTDIEAGKDR